MFFDSFAGIGRIILVGALAYIALVVMLLLSGNRTLSKMNAFDFIVTIALGSTLAAILLDDSITLTEGVTALFVLIGLQFIVTWLSVRFRRIDEMVKSQPVLLVYDGRMLDHAMKQARVTKDEILTAARTQGIASLEEVQAVVLETDGSFAVVKSSDKPPTALHNIDLSGVKVPGVSPGMKPKTVSTR